MGGLRLRRIEGQRRRYECAEEAAEEAAHGGVVASTQKATEGVLPTERRGLKPEENGVTDR